MHIEQFLGFAAVSLALALVPGPSWVYVISTTLGRDRRAGLIAVLGNATGISCHVLAVAAGLSAVLTYSATVYSALKWLGALYLIYLGIQTVRQGAGVAFASGDEAPRAPRRIFGHGVLVNLLNPKVALVMLALLPQFTDPGAGRVTLQIVSIGLVHAVIASIVLAILVAGSARAAQRFNASSRLFRVFRLGAGLTLVAAGLHLALTRG